MSIEIKAVVCGDIQENAFLAYVPGRDDCVLVDPGDDYLKLKQALGPRKLAAILLTHGHFDHIMSVDALVRDTGATVYVGREDMVMLNDPNLNGLAELMGSGAMPGSAIEAEPFDEELSVAGIDFEILPTPGHSKGSVCLYIPSEGMMFSGDTLFRAGFGRMDLYGGSPLQMRESLRRLFSLPQETRVLPGHGGATTIGEERGRYHL